MYLHIDNKFIPTISEVTDTPGPIILGKQQAKAMGYVQYPAIKPLNISSTSSPLHKVCAGTIHNAKSQTDIKNKHAQTDIKTNMIQHTTPNVKQMLKVTMLKWTSKTNRTQHTTPNFKQALKVNIPKI